MYYVLLLVVLPLIVCGFIYALGQYPKDEELIRILVTVGTCLLLGSVAVIIGFYVSTTDTEVWSGRVVSRTRDKVSCSHSYPCNPYPCGDSKHPATCWNTCYEHAYDIDWDVHFSTGTEVSIDRVDRQGLKEPRRWDAVFVGEATTETHSFTNYLLIDPDNVLLHHDAPHGFTGLIPEYPSGVYDYYRLNRFLIAGGVPIKGVKEWRWLLDQLNADLGSLKQVNVIIVLTPTADPAYEFALAKSWVGGKKNDLIVTIGVTKYPAIDWVRIITWGTDQSIKVKLRDDIEAIGTLDQRDNILRAIRQETVDHYTRRRMRDMKYLVIAEQPRGWLTIVLMLIGIGVPVGLLFLYRDEGGYYSGY